MAKMMILYHTRPLTVPLLDSAEHNYLSQFVLIGGVLQGRYTEAETVFDGIKDREPRALYLLAVMYYDGLGTTADQVSPKDVLNITVCLTCLSAFYETLISVQFQSKTVSVQKNLKHSKHLTHHSVTTTLLPKGGNFITV